MTLKEANLKCRQLAKDSVRRYFKREGVENFNWDIHGSTIIKIELYHALKSYTTHWDIVNKTYCVMTLEGNLIR
jgi:hypothetical protein